MRGKERPHDPGRIDVARIRGEPPVVFTTADLVEGRRAAVRHALNERTVTSVAAEVCNRGFAAVELPPALEDRRAAWTDT